MALNRGNSNGLATWQPHEHVLFTELDGLEGVLVDLNSRKYYQLNETASLVWRCLQQGMPIEDIAREMTERYEVTLERATLSVQSAVKSFEEQKLLSRA